MIPPLPVDFASLVAQGVVVMGKVITGVAGIFVMMSLVRMGIGWIRATFSSEGGVSDSYEGSDIGCVDWQDDGKGGGYAMMEDGRSWHVSSDGRWSEISD